MEMYLKSIYSYHKQFEQVWEETQKLILPADLRSASDIIIAGMGGSSFGGRVLLSSYSNDKLLIPVNLVTGYDLPAYADENTLVVVTSYSGNTEEIISILKQSSSRGCKIVCITSGGKLKNLVESGNVPGYIFNPKYNMAKSPRTGMGYIIGSTLSVLSRLELIDFSSKEADGTISYIQSFVEITKKNVILQAQIAKKLASRVPILVSAQHLIAGTHIWRNFMNETAKNTVFIQNIPYMNHHFLDGLTFPSMAKKDLMFVYVQSNLYSERIKRRFEITREITRQQGILDITISLRAEDKFNELWELIILGSLVSYNLAKERNVDPTSNDMVTYMKDQIQ